MSKGKKERRCKSCGKLLIDEKVPFCRRCILEGRNKAGQGISAAVAIVSAVAIADNISDTHDDTLT